MTFYVDNETDEEFSFDIDNLIELLTNKVLETVKCPYKNISLNISFTDDETIQLTNKEFRNIDKSTDVLSFPAIDFQEPADFSILNDKDPNYFDLISGELIYGDIMISLPHAHKQAIDYNHSFRREISFLLVHSLLHLSGYDHETDDERLEMEALQEQILNNLGITRENG